MDGYIALYAGGFKYTAASSKRLVEVSCIDFTAIFEQKEKDWRKKMLIAKVKLSCDMVVTATER